MAIRSKKSLRETLADNQKAEKYWAASFGKPVRALDAIPEKRTRAPNKPSEVPSEHQEQVAFVKWFKLQFAKVRIFAIPNAALRSVELASYLRSEGMTKGVPDLYIPAWNLWIEMKRQKGSVISDEQKDWREYLLSIGHGHIYGMGFEDAKQKVMEASYIRTNGLSAPCHSIAEIQEE